MLREAFSNPNPLAVLGTIGFLALFVVIVIYVASDRRRTLNTKMQNLPLEDDRHG